MGSDASRLSRTFVALAGRSVADAMHHGLVSCPIETPLRSVARMLATYRIHAILVIGYSVHDLPGGRLWGVVTDADLLAAARTGSPDEQTAGLLAATPVATVHPEDDLADAVEAMVQRQITHLIVVDARSDRPIGILSTLDVARALGGFPERHPATF